MLLRAVAHWGAQHCRNQIGRDFPGTRRRAGGSLAGSQQQHRLHLQAARKGGPGWASGGSEMPFPEPCAGCRGQPLPFELEGGGLPDSESQGTQRDPPGSASTRDSGIWACSPRPAAGSPPEPGEREGRRGAGPRDEDDPRAGTVDGNRSSCKVSEDDLTQQPHAFHLELIGKVLLKGVSCLPAPSQLGIACS